MVFISKIGLFKRKVVLEGGNQNGFILIASLAMLLVLAGVVLICIYPMSFEAHQAPIQRETLRRLRMAEQGIFGRLAYQPGGVNSAVGGYISDLGPKMIVEKYVDNLLDGYEVGRIERTMDFWFYRRFGSAPVLTGTTMAGNPEGADDIYRYDPETGFWAGYRGKRYITRPAGEERLREEKASTNVVQYLGPLFGVEKNRFHLALKGDSGKDVFHLAMVYNESVYTGKSAEIIEKLSEHTRYFNPAERLVVRVNDRRTVRTTSLSALLVYAKQPDPDNPDAVNELAPYFPSLPSRAVIETPSITERQENVTSFIFRWDPANTDTVSYSPNVDIGHTFEIGLKKLILFEDDLPVFSCGITVPPVREYQCEETDSREGHHAGCGQPFSDQYVVEIDYDG